MRASTNLKFSDLLTLALETGNLERAVDLVCATEQALRKIGETLTDTERLELQREFESYGYEYII